MNLHKEMTGKVTALNRMAKQHEAVGKSVSGTVKSQASDRDVYTGLFNVSQNTIFLL